MDVSKVVAGEEELANGGGDGDEVMEEDHQEGYGVWFISPGVRRTYVLISFTWPHRSR